MLPIRPMLLHAKCRHEPVVRQYLSSRANVTDRTGQQYSEVKMQALLAKHGRLWQRTKRSPVPSPVILASSYLPIIWRGMKLGLELSPLELAVTPLL